MRIAHLLLLILLLLSVVCLSEASKGLVLRRSKGIGGAWLERASKEELRREERGEVHVEGSAWGLHVVGLLLCLCKSRSVDVGYV